MLIVIIADLQVSLEAGHSVLGEPTGKKVTRVLLSRSLIIALGGLRVLPRFRAASR